MGFSQDYPEVPDWVEKPEGYQTDSKVKYEGNVLLTSGLQSQEKVKKAGETRRVRD